MVLCEVTSDEEDVDAVLRMVMAVIFVLFLVGNGLQRKQEEEEV